MLIIEPSCWKFAVRSHARRVAIVLVRAIIMGSTYLVEIILFLLAHCKVGPASVTIIIHALFLYHHALTFFIALSMIYLLDRIHEYILNGIVLHLSPVVYRTVTTILKLPIKFCLVMDGFILKMF